MIKAVIFDMDGVIADTEPIDFVADCNVLKSIGAVKDEKDYVKLVGLPTRHTYNKILAERNIKADVDELIRKKSVEFERVLASKGLKPSIGFNELVKKLKLKGYRLALASSSSMGRLDLVLSVLGIKGNFAAIVSANDVKMNKPAPEIYIEAAKRLNLSPEECIAIEDSETGVHSAKSAGMKCIAIRTMRTAEHDLSAADLVVESLKGINVGMLDRI